MLKTQMGMAALGAIAVAASATAAPERKIETGAAAKFFQNQNPQGRSNDNSNRQQGRNGQGRPGRPQRPSCDNVRNPQPGRNCENPEHFRPTGRPPE